MYGQKFRLFLSLNSLIKCALKLENLDTLANSHHKVQIMSFMYIVHIIKSLSIKKIQKHFKKRGLKLKILFLFIICTPPIWLNICWKKSVLNTRLYRTSVLKKPKIIKIFIWWLKNFSFVCTGTSFGRVFVLVGLLTDSVLFTNFLSSYFVTTPIHVLINYICDEPLWFTPIGDHAITFIVPLFNLANRCKIP